MDKNSKIGILGMGTEGMALAHYLLAHGYKNVLLFDQKKILEGGALKGWSAINVEFYGGEDYLERASTCEIVFRSPGIHTKKLDGLRARGIEVSSTTQYFMEHCPCPIIGVTGTKGKGTTSTLITLMLKEAGYDVYLGGNIGQSPLEFLDVLKPESYVVLEMSSFQLQDLKVSPAIAVVLMVTSEHLDYHRDQQEYWEAKQAIVRFQGVNDVAVFNEDYPSAKYYRALAKGIILTVSTQYEVEYGAFVRNGEIFLRAGREGDMEPASHADEKIAEVVKIALLGKHNLENVLPAVCVAKSLGIAGDAVQKVLYSFTGLPHRLELVREIKGVKYYNDSFSTTPETSIAATYAFDAPVILIAGGSDKGSDYTEWGMKLQQNPNLKMVILIGLVADKMERALKEAAEKMRSQNGTSGIEMETIHAPSLHEFPLKIYRSANLEEALKIGTERAVSGDVVVLSPAAASFDMFKNYKDRGEKFREMVKSL